MKKATKIVVILSFCLCIVSIALFAVLAINQFSFDPGGSIEFIAESGVDVTVSKATLYGISKKSGSGAMNSFEVTKDMTETQIQALSGYKSWSNLKLAFAEGSEGIGRLIFSVRNNSQNQSENVFVKLTTNTTLASKITVTPSADYCVNPGDIHAFVVDFVVQDPTQAVPATNFALTVELDLVKTEDVYDETEYYDEDGYEMAFNYEDTTSIATLTDIQNSPKDIVLPELVKHNNKVYTIGKIGEHAFEPLKTLSPTSLVLPNTISVIGAWAFDGQSTLKGDLVIPHSVDVIGQSAFSNCSGFTGTLTLSPRLKEITKGSFAYCQFNCDLVIPRGVVYIRDEAFLEFVGFTDIVLPEGLEYIGEKAFCDSGLVGEATLELPSTLRDIGPDAFNGCGITGELIIPESLTVIQYSAFAYTALSTIVFPATCEEIEFNAFYNSTDYRAIVVYSEEPPMLGSNAWGENKKPPIYVPDEVYDVYRTHLDWDDQRIYKLSERY